MRGGLARRLGKAEGRVAAQERRRGPGPEGPASVRWLAVLRLFLPVLERNEREPGGAEAIARVRWSIALLERYVAESLASDPWCYLEYYLHGCLLRLRWTTNGWEGRQLAFLEEEYERHLGEVVAIEKARRSPPRPSRPQGQGPALERRGTWPSEPG
jgi:hypothetical protein